MAGPPRERSEKRTPPIPPLPVPGMDQADLGHPTRWCRTCGDPYTGLRLTCPRCLTRLVDEEVDSEAKITCRHCGRESPARMHSCPGCLAELNPEPERAADAMSALLAKGGRVPRPAHLAAFADGPDCTLMRPAARSGMVFTGITGFLEASVDSRGNGAVPPLVCHDLDGSVLFRLRSYPAATRALVALDADGTPIATFIDGPVRDLAFDVRDETSAPIGRVQPAGGPQGGWDLVETGSTRLATLSSGDSEKGDMIDDEWSLHALTRALPMKPIGAVAMVLAAKCLLGRPHPVESPRARWERFEEDRQALGATGLNLGMRGRLF